MNLMPSSMLTTLTLCVVLSGCAAHTPFPPEVMEKVSPTFHFEAWRDADSRMAPAVQRVGVKELEP